MGDEYETTSGKSVFRPDIDYATWKKLLLEQIKSRDESVKKLK